MFLCLNFTISSNFSLIISLSFNLREPFIHLYFVHDRTPIYIQELLQLHTPSRNLRSSNRNLLVKVARNSFTNSLQVLQILFQFGLSYQCEIYHRHKWNVIESLHFFQKTCYHGNDIMLSVAPPKSKAIVLLRERVGEIFSNSYIACY